MSSGGSRANVQCICSRRAPFWLSWLRPWLYRQHRYQGFFLLRSCFAKVQVASVDMWLLVVPSRSISSHSHISRFTKSSMNSFFISHVFSCLLEALVQYSERHSNFKLGTNTWRVYIYTHMQSASRYSELLCCGPCAQVALLAACVKKGLKVLSATGAGARLDPTRIRIADIKESSNDPLSRSVSSVA